MTPNKEDSRQSHVQASESLRCAAAPPTSVDLSSTLSFACVRIFWRHPCAQLDRTGTRSVSTHFIQLPVTRFVECPIVCFRAHLLLCSCERDSPRVASVLNLFKESDLNATASATNPPQGSARKADSVNVFQLQTAVTGPVVPVSTFLFVVI